MKPVAIIHHEDTALHDTGGYHPERPARIDAVVNALKRETFPAPLRWVKAEPASLLAIEAVHDAHYIRRIEEQCLRGAHALDGGDTPVCEDSFAVARLAAGAAMQGVDLVMQSSVDAAFSAMRPPGHHAERAEAMGFCLINSVAVAARYAQQKYGLERVAVVDVDVHHGNGTQAIFYDDPTVAFASFHQYPFYPGTGSRSETGEGSGKGFTLNVPLIAGSDISEYMLGWQNEMLPYLEKSQPELLLISAGFDAHRDDPLANIYLTADDFATLTKALVCFAKQSCGGRVVSVLEGGYNLEALAASAVKHIHELCDEE